MREALKKIDDWCYEHCWECAIGLYIVEFLAAVKFYPF